MNKVVLEFPENLTRITGRVYGEDTYSKQIEGKIEFDNNFIIEFPSFIISVGTSFVQGLFSGIVKKIGLKEMLNRLTVKTSNEDLTKEIVSEITL